MPCLSAFRPPKPLMAKDVGVVIPPFEIEFSPVRKEGEAGIGQLFTPFALKTCVEFFLQCVKMEDIGGSIAQLLWRQDGLAPVRSLLLLRDFHAKQLAAQILQAMAIRKSADKLGCDFGAVNRAGRNAEIMQENSDIEPSEVEDLQNLRISQKLPQIWSIVASFLELHEMRVSIAGGKLHNAKPVAMGL